MSHESHQPLSAALIRTRRNLATDFAAGIVPRVDLHVGQSINDGFQLIERERDRARGDSDQGLPSASKHQLRGVDKRVVVEINGDGAIRCVF